MGIKTNDVTLTCDYGPEELSIEKSGDDMVCFVFRASPYDEDKHTLHVKHHEAKLFIETIRKATDD